MLHLRPTVDGPGGRGPGRTAGAAAGTRALAPPRTLDFAFSVPAPDFASLQEGTDSPKKTTVYDRNGQVATLPFPGNSFFSTVAIELEGERHIVAMDSGLIYDEAFKEVGTIPLGHAYPTLTGVYDTRGDDISYVPYGADDPLWNPRLRGRRMSCRATSPSSSSTARRCRSTGDL